jgi:5-methyltetrahydropteroyltriglutamate--homocysteine methyltransferase
VLPFFYDVPIDEFVLDFANREMVDVDLLKGLPEDKDVQIGVLDIRTMQIESPEQVAERIRKVTNVISPERVTLSTDCGMKPLPRLVAKMKLQALVAGAEIVRAEIS